MAYNLTGNKVSKTYQHLVQYRNGNYYDGSGNLLSIGSGIQGTTGAQGTTGVQGTQGSSAIFTDISTDNVLYSTALYFSDPGLAMPNAVGGISAGTTVADLYGNTVTQILDNLLFPTVDPSVAIFQSASISGVSGATVEVGTLYTPTTPASFNQGVIRNGDQTLDGSLVGLPNTYTFYLPNSTLDATYSTSSLSQSHTFSGYNITLSNTQRWRVTVDYDAGTGLYYDNKDASSSVLDYLRGAGSSTAYTLAVNGRRRYWWGTGTAGSEPTDSAGVRALSDTGLLTTTSNTGTFDIIIPASTRGVWFFIPSGRTVLVNYIESLNVDVTGTFTTSSITVNDAAGTSQTYTSHVTDIGGIGYPEIATYRVTIT